MQNKPAAITKAESKDANRCSALQEKVEEESMKVRNSKRDRGKEKYTKNVISIKL